jgi:hypothetical protein
MLFEYSAFGASALWGAGYYNIPIPASNQNNCAQRAAAMIFPLVRP